MVSLLEKAQRRFIRMSEAGACSLKIAHNMMGTPYQERASRAVPMALMLGTALEPFCIQYLGAHGLTFYFTGDQQLELATDGPWMVGHNDGIAALEGETSWWLEHNMPRQALDILKSGQPMLAEVKTMNGDSFKQFMEIGLQGAFLSQYPPQIQSYLNAVANAQYDEMWLDHDEIGPDGQTVHVYGSNSFKALLDEKGWQRPQFALLIAFCKPTEEFGFKVIEIDHEAIRANRERLGHVVDELDDGRLPAPSHPTGEAPECFFCPFAYVCPAVQARIEARGIPGLDDIPIDLPDGGAEINEDLDRFTTLKAEHKALGDELAAMRKTLADKVGMGKLQTNKYFINLAEVKGRRSVDLDVVREALGEVPYKVGNPSTRLTVTPLYGPSGEPETND